MVLSISGWVDPGSIQTFSTPIQLGGVIKAYLKGFIIQTSLYLQNFTCLLDRVSSMFVWYCDGGVSLFLWHIGKNHP